MNRPEPFTIGEPVGRRIRSVAPIRPHRLAGAMRDGEMLEEIERRLRDGSPKSGAKHVRLTDSRQIGENEFEEMGSPFHWTTYVCVIVVAFVLSVFAAAIVSGFLASVFA